MRRRRVLLGVAVAAFGGCSSRERDGTDTAGTDATPTPASVAGQGTPTGAPSSSPTDPKSQGTQVPDDTGETGATEAAVESARGHLAVAFDELREMRPVGPENIRVSEARFSASDHERVRERIEAAETALDRTATESEEAPESVPALRAAVDLAGSGRELYAALRRGIRAEWRFERHCFGAKWADAREQADRAERAVAAWERHDRAVTDAVEAAGTAGPPSVPRLSLRAWYRDGAVLGSVSGPWSDVLSGFAAYVEAVRLDEAGLGAMNAGEHRRARKRFVAAAESVGAAHHRLARAKADGAQGFQTYAVPIRRRAGPFRKAYFTQAEAALAAVEGETDRAETLETKAMNRIVETERKHPLPRPEGG